MAQQRAPGTPAVEVRPYAAEADLEALRVLVDTELSEPYRCADLARSAPHARSRVLMPRSASSHTATSSTPGPRSASSPSPTAAAWAQWCASWTCTGACSGATSRARRVCDWARPGRPLTPLAPAVLVVDKPFRQYRIGTRSGCAPPPPPSRPAAVVPALTLTARHGARPPRAVRDGGRGRGRGGAGG